MSVDSLPYSESEPSPFHCLFDPPISESDLRNHMPVSSGCFDYYPQILLLVALLSSVGTKKHNAGLPMHWARDRSTDHDNKILRHTMERGGGEWYSYDREDGMVQRVFIPHVVAAAWRALAQGQQEIEERFNLLPSRGSRGLRPHDKLVSGALPELWKDPAVSDPDDDIPF